MASVITDVQPRTIKAGDFITVTGFGFSPAFGVNRINVNLGVAAVILSESDTVIVAVVPAGIPTNQQVEVIASRTDTQEASEPFVVWSLASAAELRDFDSSMPGQVPGPREAAHLDVDVPDVGQARDYERVAAHALRIANEILEQAGDIFTSDGAGLARLPIGGGGMELHTRTAEALDLYWGPSSRWITLRWGAELTGDAIAQFTQPHGGAFGAAGLAGGPGTEHGVPFDGGRLTRVGVQVHFSSGAVLALVRVLVNGAQVYTSGAIAVAAGSSHVATFSAAVSHPDLVEIECTQDGADGNPFNVTASVTLREDHEAVRQADTIFATDEVTVDKTGNQAASADDSVEVTDLAAVELTRPTF